MVIVIFSVSILLLSAGIKNSNVLWIMSNKYSFKKSVTKCLKIHGRFKHSCIKKKKFFHSAPNCEKYSCSFIPNRRSENCPYIFLFSFLCLNFLWFLINFSKIPEPMKWILKIDKMHKYKTKFDASFKIIMLIWSKFF